MEDKAIDFNDKSLEQAVGGVSTHMMCGSCPPGYDSMMWAGDYRGQGPFRCPHCGNMTLFGTNDISDL